MTEWTKDILAGLGWLVFLVALPAALGFVLAIFGR